MFRELCGDMALRNVVLVTTMWGELSCNVGESHESELSSNFFKAVLDKGAEMVRHYNTAQSTHDVVRMVIGNYPVALQIQRVLVDEHKDIVDTAAGKAVSRELNEQIRRRRAELKMVQEEMMQALKKGDEGTRQELEEKMRKLQEQVEKIRKDSEGMALNFSVERMQAKMKEMEEETRKEHDRQMADLNHRLQEAVNSSAADRAKLQQEIRNLQNRLDQPNDDSGRCTVM